MSLEEFQSRAAILLANTKENDDVSLEYGDQSADFENLLSEVDNVQYAINRIKAAMEQTVPGAQEAAQQAVALSEEEKK